MPSEIHVYEWTCPICGQTTQSINTSDTLSVEGEAENALLGHLKTTSDDVNGESSEFPPSVNARTVLDNVDVHEVVDDQTDSDPLAGQPGRSKMPTG